MTTTQSAWDAYLGDAVGAAFEVSSRWPVPTQITDTLTAAAGYLLQRDPNLRRLGRAAAFNGLSVFRPSRAGQQYVREWAATAEERLRVIWSSSLREIEASPDAAPGLIAQLRKREDTALKAYLKIEDGPEHLFPFVVELGRLCGQVSELTRLVLPEALRSAAKLATGTLDRHRHELQQAVLEPVSERPDQGARGFWGYAAWGDAVIDALVNPPSRRLTLLLHENGLLDRHWAAVREAVGDPIELPVFVLSNDRWMREWSAPGLTDA